MIRYHFLIVTCLFMVFGCNVSRNPSKADNKNTVNTTPQSQNIISGLKGTWILQSLDGKFLEKDPEQNSPALVFFEISERVTGFAGCNRIANGKIDVLNDSIHFSSLATTKKMCEGKSMETERVFLSALRSCNRFEIKDGILILLNSKNILAAFKRKE